MTSTTTARRTGRSPNKRRAGAPVWLRLIRGLGVSVLPELLLKNCPTEAEALPMDPPQERILGMGVPQLKTASPVTRNFMRYVQAYVERMGETL